MQQEGTGNHYSTNLRKQLRYPEITATPLQCRLGLDVLGKQTGGANGGNWTPDRSDGGGSGADEGQGERPGGGVRVESLEDLLLQKPGSPLGPGTPRDSSDCTDNVP